MVNINVFAFQGFQQPEVLPHALTVQHKAYHTNHNNTVVLMNRMGRMLVTITVAKLEYQSNPVQIGIITGFFIQASEFSSLFKGHITIN